MHRHQVTELVYHLRPHMTVQGWILLHRYQDVHHQQHHTSKLLQAQDKELAILRLQHQPLYNKIHTSLRPHLQAMGHQAEAG
jgi:hypothetical protein